MRVFLTLFLCIIFMQSIGQTVDWLKAMGSSQNWWENDPPNIDSDILLLDDHVYICGVIKKNPHFDTISLEISSQNRGFIAKFDTLGNIQWLRLIQGGNPSVGSMKCDSNGNIIVAARANSGTMTIGSTVISNTTHGNSFLLKFDQDGDLVDYFKAHHPLQWVFAYSRISDIEIDADGNVYLLGFFRDQIVFDTITLTDNSTYNQIVTHFFVKLNANFEVVWAQEFGPYSESSGAVLGEDGSIGLALGDSGDIYLSILHRSLVYNDSLLHPTASNDRLSLMRVDSLGAIQWFKTLSSPHTNYFNESDILHYDGKLFWFGAFHSQPVFPNPNAFLVLDGDTIQDPEDYSQSFIFELTQEGDLVHHEIMGMVMGNWSFRKLVPHGGKLRFGIAARLVFYAGNYSRVLAGSQYAGYMLILEYDPVSHHFSELGYMFSPLMKSCAGAVFDDAGNGYVYGTFMNYVQADTFFVNPLWSTNDNKFYLGRYFDCSYLAPEISGPSSFCSGGAAPLTLLANDHDSVNWYLNGSLITGEHDSMLQAQVAGNYRVEVFDEVCKYRSASHHVNSSIIAASLALNLNIDTLCSADDPVTLYGGMPLGGYYSGHGVLGSSFDPSIAGTGPTTIRYIATDSMGCTDSLAATVHVFAVPAVYFFQSLDTLCAFESAVLTGGYPSGGFYSGPGVTGETFNAALAGPGTHTLYYTFTNTNDCAASDSIEVYVSPVPTLSFDLPIDEFCTSESMVAITGASPAGGVFSGTGVGGAYFFPSLLSPGTYVIAYEYTDSGCSAQVFDTVQVDSSVSASLPVLDSVCLSATNLVLDHGLPTGGTFIGTGISNNAFNAFSVGMGTHAIQYVVNNGCGTDTAASVISVIASPVLAVSITDVLCHDDSTGVAEVAAGGGVGPYQYLWTNGMTGASQPGLPAAWIGVTASGNMGCVVADSIYVDQSDSIGIVLDSVVGAQCYGLENGALYVHALGGHSPYTYVWNTGDSGTVLSAVSSGHFTVTVTDSAGCEAVQTFEVGETEPITWTSSLSHVTCAGMGNGEIAVSGSGSGGGALGYAWNTGSVDSVLTALDPGTYYLTLTDGAGCVAMDTFSVETPDSLGATFDLWHLSCADAMDGAVLAHVTGGTEPYTYYWNSGHTTDSIFGLAAGEYTLNLVDSMGCADTFGLVLNQADSILIAFSASDSILCHGGSIDSLEAVISGGTPGYSLIWNTGDTASTLTNLVSGTYTLMVTDLAGCVGIASHGVTAPDEILVSFPVTSSPVCAGGADGVLEVNAVGGTGTLTFLWSTGDSTAMIDSLTTGGYYLTVTDEQGCNLSLWWMLEEPDSMQLLATVHEPLCHGDSNGMINLAVQHAQGGLIYSWNNGATTALVDSIPSATYAVTVTDSAGCQVSANYSIGQPDPIQVLYSISENNCHGDTAASIVGLVIGGTGPYTYAWSTGATSNSLVNLSEGTYSLTVLDSNACSLDSTFTVTDPLPLTVAIDSVQVVPCFGDSAGGIYTSTTGGTGLLNYNWNTGASGSSIAGIPAGTYTLTVTDALGCVCDTSMVLTEAAELMIVPDTLIEPFCFGDSNGSIAVTAAGGVGGYFYQWSNLDTGNVASSLVAGNYGLTLTDGNACTKDTIIYLAEPAALGVVATVFPGNCDNTQDGEIVTAAYGGFGAIQFLWSTGSGNDSLGGLLPGVYSLTVSDAHACQFDTSIYIAYQHAAPQPFLGADTTACEGDSLLLDPGTGNVNFWSTGDTTGAIVVHQSGVISVVSVDTAGCAGEDTIVIDFAPLPVFSLGDDTLICSAHLEDGLVLFGPPGFASYLWSSGHTGLNDTLSMHGQVYLMITDTIGCTAVDSMWVMDDTCLSINKIREAHSYLVYPNPGRDEVSIEHASRTIHFSVRCFDMEGRLVSATTFNNRHVLQVHALASGTYILEMEQENGTLNHQKLVVQ